MTDDQDASIHQLPAAGVVFDLDAEVRTDEKVPFVANVQGRAITMADPENLDWKDLLDIGDNPIAFLRYCVSEEDREYLFGLDMEGWKLGRLMEAYQKHYEVDKKIAEFQRRERIGI